MPRAYEIPVTISPAIALRQAVRFRKIFIPLPSFANQAEDYMDHCKAASTAAEVHLRGERAQVSSQVVFLSRFSLNGQLFRAGRTVPAARFAMPDSSRA